MYCALYTVEIFNIPQKSEIVQNTKLVFIQKGSASQYDTVNQDPVSTFHDVCIYI